jgi:hypothetical protein
MILYLGLLILFKLIISEFFNGVENNHSLFRSFFCFFISSLSIFNSIIDWNNLITNPLDTTFSALVINKLMLSYMIVDTIYFILTKNTRLELVFHHIICIIVYGLFYDKKIFSFLASAEILSAFNWIGMLYPEIEWANKIFKLYSMIFIRSFIWIFGLVFMSRYTYYFYVGILLTIIFLGLDCFWSYIIILNYFKHINFIKKKIISHTSKKIINH